MAWKAQFFSKIWHKNHCLNNCVRCLNPRWLWMADPKQLGPKESIHAILWPWSILHINVQYWFPIASEPPSGITWQGSPLIQASKPSMLVVNLIKHTLSGYYYDFTWDKHNIPSNPPNIFPSKLPLMHKGKLCDLNIRRNSSGHSASLFHLVYTHRNELQWCPNTSNLVKNFVENGGKKGQVIFVCIHFCFSHFIFVLVPRVSIPVEAHCLHWLDSNLFRSFLYWFGKGKRYKKSEMIN